MAELRDKLHLDESIVWDVATRTMRLREAWQDYIASSDKRTARSRDLREYADEGSPAITDWMQTAVDDVRGICGELLLPYGVTEIDDTIHVGRGGLSDPGLFDTCCIKGRSVAYNGTRGTMLRATHSDRPALNVQVAPYTVLENFSIAGQNILHTANANNPHPLRDVGDYYVAGLTPSRYAPYAGIAINAFGDTAPSSLPGATYPNQPAGAIGNGGGVTVRNCLIRDFEIGFVVNPNGSGAGTGNTVKMDFCLITNCAYGVSLCDSNGRNVSLHEVIMAIVHTCLTNNTHGSRGGYPPVVIGGEWNACYQWIDMTAQVASFKMIGVSGESMNRIGSWYGGQNPISLQGCQPHIGGDPTDPKEALQFVTSGPAEISEMVFSIMDGSPSVINTAGGAPVRWSRCLFNSADTVSRDYHVGIGYHSYGGSSQLDRCHSRNSSAANFDASGVTSSPFQTVDQDDHSARMTLTLGTQLITIAGAGATYKVDCGNRGWVDSSGISAITWDDNAETVSFTATAGEFLVGDILMCGLKSTAPGRLTGDGQVVALRILPLMRVTISSGTSVTAEAIWHYDDIDQAQQAYLTWILPDQWATRATFTGTWTTGTTVTTNTAPNLTLRAGDFIRAAAGLPSLVRVVSVDSTTITLSKSVTGARTAEPLYFGRLTAI